MDDSRLRVNTTDDGSSSLTLDPAMPSDAGLYKGKKKLLVYKRLQSNERVLVNPFNYIY